MTAKVTESRFSFIFAPELHERLFWFERLRWLAVIGLALAAVTGRAFGFDSVWPSLFIVASVVAIYNLGFHWLMCRRPGRIHPYGNLRAIAISQIVLDLSALMATVHFTGGLRSPLLPFFAFHMAIGTIMISTRFTYLLAGATCLGGLALYVLEARGVLEFHPLGPAAAGGGTPLPNLLTLSAALFGIVYLTGSVTKRFKQRNIEIYETTEALSERTEELQRLLDEIAEVERRKSHYMRISAHQLRSPVGTIKASLQVLLDGYVEPSSERGRKLLRGAAERADGLLLTINDLLDLAKIREGRGSKAPWSRGININQLLADLFDALGPTADGNGVELRPDFEGVATLAWGLPPDLVHGFENLIYNAIKYSHPGGHVTVELRVHDGLATVRVIDEGIGIPAEYVDQIFMEFVRTPNARRHAAEGTGLGLAITREVVQAHGGWVHVESREGEGSTFVVVLPLDHVPAEVRSLLHASNESGYGADTREGASPED